MFEVNYVSSDATWKFNCSILPQENAYPQVVTDAYEFSVGKQVFIRKPYNRFYAKPVDVQQAIDGILKQAEIYADRLAV